MLECLRPGPLTTVQDLGRPGYAHLGVAHSGALDVPALVAANRIVGNDDGAAALEVTFGGLRLRARVDVVCALTGAPAQAGVDGRTVPHATAFAVPAGGEIRLATPRRGVRSYLAVAGGVDVPPVLGSRSTDTIGGVGPAPLRAGDLLPVAPLPGGHRACPDGDPARPGAPEAPVLPDDLIRLRVTLGPRADWFADPYALLDGEYRLVAADRIGARLGGPGLVRDRGGELPSEGMVLGAVQVPSDGQPIVFLADHPVTGGYPVVAVVDAADLAPLAQARPGARVVFHGPERGPR